MQTAAPYPYLFPRSTLLNAYTDGYTILLAYFRLFGIRSVKVKRIIEGVGLEDTHGLRTRLGWALGRLVRQGYLTRRNNGRRAVYVPTRSLRVFMEEHPCLTGCHAESGTCHLFNTDRCPFRQGGTVVNLGLDG